jgi:hypothetical protein
MPHQVRRWQQGSVYKTGKRLKTWYGIWREDVLEADGKMKRRQRNVRLDTFADLPTQGAARDVLAKQIGASLNPKVEMTLSELFERWKKVASLSLKASTYGHYVNALKSYVLPVFGKCQIARIERYEIESFFATQATKYSRSTIRSMRISFGLLLSYAVQNKWLKENPSKGVKLPRPENCAGRHVQRKVLSPSQTTSIAAELSEPYATQCCSWPLRDCESERPSRSSGLISRARFSMCSAACTTARSTAPRAGIRNVEFRFRRHSLSV